MPNCLSRGHQQTTASKKRGRKPKSKAEGEKAEKVTIKKEVGVEEVENVKLRLRKENFKLIKKVKELEEKCVGKDKLIEIRDMELKLKEQEIKELNKYPVSSCPRNGLKQKFFPHFLVTFFL